MGYIFLTHPVELVGVEVIGTQLVCVQLVGVQVVDERVVRTIALVFEPVNTKCKCPFASG